VSKVDLQLEAVRVLNNGTHYRVFDSSAIQIDADFVTGLEMPAWLLLAGHGGGFYRRLQRF